MIDTCRGVASTELVTLNELTIGDTVLGVDTGDGAPRTVHHVVAPLGHYAVPSEGVILRIMDWFGPDTDLVCGVLVQNTQIPRTVGGRGESMFAMELTPMVERVTAWA